MAQTLKEEIKLNIVTAAVKLFKSYGYHQTTMRDIAKGAGLSVGNVYRYFPNKRALYDEIIKPFYLGVLQITENLNDLMDQLSANEVSEKELMVFTGYNQFRILFEKEKDAVLMVLKDTGSAQFHETFEMFSKMLVDTYEHIFSVYGDTEIDYSIFAKAFSNALIYGFITIIQESKMEEVEEEVKRFMTFSFSMIKQRLMNLD